MPDYLIKTTLTASPIEDRKPIIVERIVRAPNKARAIAHVTSDTITCEVATLDDAMRIAGQGGKIETASE